MPIRKLIKLSIKNKNYIKKFNTMKYSESASFSFFYIYLKKTNEIKCEATGCFFLVYFFFSLQKWPV